MSNETSNNGLGEHSGAESDLEEDADWESYLEPTLAREPNPYLSAIGSISCWMMVIGVLVTIIALSANGPEWLTAGISLAVGGASIGFTWLCASAFIHEARKFRRYGHNSW